MCCSLSGSAKWFYVYVICKYKEVLLGQCKGMLVSKMLFEMLSEVFPKLIERSIETSICIETHSCILAKLVCKKFLMLCCHHTINIMNLKVTGDENQAPYEQNGSLSA